MPGPVFAILTDFGLQDPYLAQMKGVLLQRVPNCMFLDISHEVQPQQVGQAGFFLTASWSYLPVGSICLAVVDPGVGTERRILHARKQGRSVLAPDNGLLSQLLASPGDSRIVDITPNCNEPQASTTFHGRDIFAPLAADLALGANVDALGRELDPNELLHLELASAFQSGPEITARVVHVDRFGNCILNLAAVDWSARFDRLHGLRLLVPQPEPALFVTTYARIPEGSFGLLPGSQGFYELACNQASCAKRLGLKIGDQATFRIED